MKECKRCGISKNWSGSDIRCPFQDSEEFSDENWNCGIINQIRELCELAMEGTDKRLHYQYCDDQKYVTINIDNIELDDRSIGMCLWVTWYKSRGRTDDMWILDSRAAPRRPKFEELKKIIDYYENIEE